MVINGLLGEVTLRLELQCKPTPSSATVVVCACAHDEGARLSESIERVVRCPPATARLAIPFQHDYPTVDGAGSATARARASATRVLGRALDRVSQSAACARTCLRDCARHRVYCHGTCVRWARSHHPNRSQRWTLRAHPQVQAGDRRPRLVPRHRSSCAPRLVSSALSAVCAGGACVSSTKIKAYARAHA
jgi:hypothetical protein